MSKVRVFDAVRVQLGDLTVTFKEDNDGHWNMDILEPLATKLRLGFPMPLGGTHYRFAHEVTHGHLKSPEAEPRPRERRANEREDGRPSPG